MFRFYGRNNIGVLFGDESTILNFIHEESVACRDMGRHDWLIATGFLFLFLFGLLIGGLRGGFGV